MFDRLAARRTHAAEAESDAPDEDEDEDEDANAGGGEEAAAPPILASRVLPGCAAETWRVVRGAVCGRGSRSNSKLDPPGPNVTTSPGRSRIGAERR